MLFSSAQADTLKVYQPEIVYCSGAKRHDSQSCCIQKKTGYRHVDAAHVYRVERAYFTLPHKENRCTETAAHGFHVFFCTSVISVLPYYVFP